MHTITSKLTLDDLLIQAAEEASELAQALTKYYRVMHGSNPTPVTLAEAREAIVEEIADVKSQRRRCGESSVLAATISPMWRRRRLRDGEGG